jgi:hypothetical protein
MVGGRSTGPVPNALVFLGGPCLRNNKEVGLLKYSPHPESLEDLRLILLAHMKTAQRSPNARLTLVPR